MEASVSKAIIRGAQSRAHLLWHLLKGDDDLRRLGLALDRVVGRPDQLLLQVRCNGSRRAVTRDGEWRSRPLGDLASSVKLELLESDPTEV